MLVFMPNSGYANRKISPMWFTSLYVEIGKGSTKDLCCVNSEVHHTFKRKLFFFKTKENIQTHRSFR